MFQDLINLITPGALTDFMLMSSQEIDPRFYEQKEEKTPILDQQYQRFATNVIQLQFALLWIRASNRA